MTSLREEPKVEKSFGVVKCPTCGLDHKFFMWLTPEGKIKFEIDPRDDVEIKIRYKIGTRIMKKEELE